MENNTVHQLSHITPLVIGLGCSVNARGYVVTMLIPVPIRTQHPDVLCMVLLQLRHVTVTNLTHESKMSSGCIAFWSTEASWSSFCDLLNIKKRKMTLNDRPI